MNNPKTRQQWIYDLLISKPSLSYVDGLAKYGQKWAKSKTTFDKDWKKAQVRLKEYQKTINDEKLKESIKQEKEAVKRNILSKHDAMEVLSNLARGVASKIEDKVVIPNANDRIKAIAELSKFSGWYEPEKVEQDVTVNPFMELMKKASVVDEE